MVERRHSGPAWACPSSSHEPVHARSSARTPLRGNSRPPAAQGGRRFEEAVDGCHGGGGLTYEGAREYWTPRRLTLDIRGVTARSADQREEKKGPRTDANEKAIEGFLRSAGLSSISEAHVHSDPKKGEFYVAHLLKPGRPAEEIIAEVMPGIIRNFPWPKPMRSGAASARPGALRWVRPLQSILCTFGPENEETQIVDFEVDGIRAGNVTYGHRFHAPGEITVRRFADYVDKLERAKVVLDASGASRSSRRMPATWPLPAASTWWRMKACSRRSPASSNGRSCSWAGSRRITSPFPAKSSA